MKNTRKMSEKHAKMSENEGKFTKNKEKVLVTRVQVALVLVALVKKNPYRKFKNN